MGDHDVAGSSGCAHTIEFTRALLRDLRALEVMLESGSIGIDCQRIGAEQEMFLVDSALRPAPVAVEVLASAGDPRLTTELARFNLEANLSPRELAGDCLSSLHEEVDEVVRAARNAAAGHGADVLLAGILPTLAKADLNVDNMVPQARYSALDRAFRRARGRSFQILIKGIDELQVTHDSIILEACNTSFQLHLQVAPQDFARLYNLAQVVSAPLLAAAVNSPVLFQRRLWCETRVALYEQSIDYRTEAHAVRNHPGRALFGDDWVKDSVIEIFRDDIARFRVMLTTAADEDPLGVVARGGVPALRALRLHNGTVYRWNRPCYGVHDGIPHLRIENRILPAGPTVVDEIANAAFFYGTVLGLSDARLRIERLISFDDVKANFFAAARHGLAAQFCWLKGRSVPAVELLVDELVPLARRGLIDAGVDRADVDLYLDVFEERVQRNRTGARWLLQSLATMRGDSTVDQRLRAITAELLERQKSGLAVHEWDLACRGADPAAPPRNFGTVGQIMSTDLFTVQEDDLVDLAACVMDWKHLRHLPVESADGHLTGLVTHRGVLHLVTLGAREPGSGSVLVREVMIPDPVTVTPQTSTLDAMTTMRERGISCLPVVEDGILVGTLTEHDLLVVARHLLEDSTVSSATPRPAAEEAVRASATEV